MNATSEADLLERIISTTPGHEGIAIRNGWEVLHLRPGRTRHGWVTPVQGSLGTGWPDLVLARPPRLIAAELKAPGKSPSAAQRRVLDVLRDCGIECHVWRPSDWLRIAEVLR